MENSKSDFFVDELLDQMGNMSGLNVIFRAQSDSAKVGFDFTDIDLVRNKVIEEVREMLEAFDNRKDDLMHFREELGDCFFALINLCRHIGADPESLARENAVKYLARCKYIEDHLREAGKYWRDLTLDEMYALWKQAKQSGL